MPIVRCTNCSVEFHRPPSQASGRRFCSRECVVDLSWRIDKNGPNGCWVWTGAKGGKGYGRVGAGHTTMAHRVMYERHVGAIPDGLQIDHKCKNKSCVNPEHLEPVTGKVNVARADRTINARNATSCKNGHPWTKVSTYQHPNGSRVCRICVAISQQKRKSA